MVTVQSSTSSRLCLCFCFVGCMQSRGNARYWRNRSLSVGICVLCFFAFVYFSLVQSAAADGWDDRCWETAGVGLSLWMFVYLYVWCRLVCCVESMGCGVPSRLPRFPSYEYFEILNRRNFFCVIRLYLELRKKLDGVYCAADYICMVDICSCVPWCHTPYCW